eukprot:m.62265 g.62265  ORF g.62265 m.62265 type:complete len:52 (-) comp11500_c0_seq1:696-851(-)
MSVFLAPLCAEQIVFASKAPEMQYLAVVSAYETGFPNHAMRSSVTEVSTHQ